MSAETLAREGSIVREHGSGTRAEQEEHMQAHRITPQVVTQMSSDEAVKQAVMAGMGVSLQSLHNIGLELAHGLSAVPRVDGLPGVRRWHVINTLAKTWSPAAQAFRYCVLERGEACLAAYVPNVPARGKKPTPVQ